jgi:hypothetical protein
LYHVVLPSTVLDPYDYTIIQNDNLDRIRRQVWSNTTADSIQQVERVQHGIITGAALVGPYSGSEQWKALEQTSGTVIEYHRLSDESYRHAPDWRDTARRRKVVGQLIRSARERLQDCNKKPGLIPPNQPGLVTP